MVRFRFVQNDDSPFFPILFVPIFIFGRNGKASQTNRFECLWCAWCQLETEDGRLSTTGSRQQQGQQQRQQQCLTME